MARTAGRAPDGADAYGHRYGFWGAVCGIAGGCGTRGGWDGVDFLVGCNLASGKEKIGKQFFSEEKNQKTFALDAIPIELAMTSALPGAQSKKSFGFFLQKRTSSL